MLAVKETPNTKVFREKALVLRAGLNLGVKCMEAFVVIAPRGIPIVILGNVNKTKEIIIIN